jgi:hypothetical protein
MQICYLDESGNYVRKGTTPCFVLLGLAIPATAWRGHDAEVAKVLHQHDMVGEIHTAWIARRYPEQERIAGFEQMDATARRNAVLRERKIDLGKAGLKGRKAVELLSKNYRKTVHYIHLTHKERHVVLRTLADLIGTWGDAVLFADAQQKAAHPAAMSDERILEFAFEQVVSRFHHYLERRDVTPGILVQDRNDTAADRLTRLARRYHERGTPWASYTRIVETPLFVDSCLTSMVQLADLCAYATRRFFENNETDLFNRIYPRFHRQGAKLVGLRHFTGKGACGCIVCKDHGR